MTGSRVSFGQPTTRRYLENLREAAALFDCKVHAYALMTNHVHLLLTPETSGAVGRVMQTLGRRYVRYINDSMGRSGTLWEGRYKASMVDSDRYVLACYRYIELNPVRAGMVRDPVDYPWSSFARNGYGGDDSLVHPHPAYQSLSADNKERRGLYRDFVCLGIDEKELEEIRLYTQRQRVLGSAKFQKGHRTNAWSTRRTGGAWATS